jgi:hypothetical protein
MAEQTTAETVTSDVLILMGDWCSEGWHRRLNEISAMVEMSMTYKREKPGTTRPPALGEYFSLDGAS